jgi:hypothetical protein
MDCARLAVHVFAVFGLMASSMHIALAADSAQCIDAARSRIGDSPAFKVTCRTVADCEFEPSQALNASAMALIDSLARELRGCWRKAGLKGVTELPAPEGMKVLIRRYSAPEETEPGETCILAEFRPFGEEQMTTSFRARCKDK